MALVVASVVGLAVVGADAEPTVTPGGKPRDLVMRCGSGLNSRIRGHRLDNDGAWISLREPGLPRVVWPRTTSLLWLRS